MVDITMALVPVGNPTDREIAALREELRGTLERMRGVESVAPVRTAAPDGAKGIGELLGGLLVGVPPGVITGVFDTVKAVLTRPAQPQAEVEVTAQGVKLKFDPRTVSLDDMTAFVDKLRAAPATG